MNITSLFSKINSWNDFNNTLVPLNNKQKGDAFELLSKVYFIIDHKYNNYDNIWLLSEVPKKELEIIGLESRDLGIDLIAKKGDEYHAIQCKYHTDKYQAVTFREVSTFISLLGGYDKLTEGYICSSAISTSKNYDDVKKKPISKILSDTWSNLDEDFFDRVKKYLKKEKYSPEPFYPRPHQEKATNEAYNHFIKNKEPRGKLIFPCGAGKSLTGFWMMEKLDAMSTVIAVPSLSLIKQTLDVYLKEIVARGIKVNWLCICSDEGIGSNTEIKFKTEDIGVPCKTDSEYIKNWLKENKDTRNIIFTTYQSSRLIADISKELNHTFDLGILDEAHKTVGSSDKLFSHLLFEENISIKSRIFMTATERFYRGSKDDIVSMDDTDVYGDIFAQMSFKEAIDLKLLTDYKIITIDIKKSEISEFIKDNGLVELNNVWKKETEARSLASMLALRKAMNQFPIKNAVSFHSSIEKAKRNKELHTHITANYGYDPIDTYTVSGKDKTSKRNDIIQEFASSEKALITNARCLTEGVDVPNIDCIVFADPKKSKVDIVQALGRALRKKDGKDWGYVILPVIYDEKTNEIDNENFNDILSIVRGLAANDERIIEYFKDKSLLKGGEKGVGAEVFSMISETLSESNFAEQLNIRIWETLSKFNWTPYAEAQKFGSKLGYKSRKEWIDYCKLGTLPYYIPKNPQFVYKNNGWENWGNFLDFDWSPKFKDWMPFEEARDFIRELKFTNNNQYTDYIRSTDINIPVKPYNTYKNDGWIDIGDFLGTFKKSNVGREYKTFEEAKTFLKTLNLRSRTQWSEYCENGNKPDDLPVSLSKIYNKNPNWAGLGDFLGNDYVATNKRKYLTYKKAKAFVRKLNLKNQKDWNVYRKSNKPLNIPSNPSTKYQDSGWEDWGVFLGTYTISNSKINYDKYIVYDEAEAFVRKLNLKNQKDWQAYKNTKNFNVKIPRSPQSIYKDKGWKDLGTFIGTGNISNNKRNYRSFKQARVFAKKLNFNSVKEWKDYSRSTNRPFDIPSSPNTVYEKKGWVSYSDWLGTNVVAPQDIKFISFTEAKEFVKKLGLKTNTDWREYKKSGERPSFISANPDTKYKNKWKGWADFFGHTKREYYTFVEAKEEAILMGFKKSREYRLNYKSNVFFPSNPPKYYKNSGWKGWADFLGKE